MKRPEDWSKRLVVEGVDDRHSVVGLMRAHIAWPQRIEDAPVYIDDGKGVENILVDGYLSSILKTSKLKTLGVMLDADSDPQGRYISVFNLCRSLFPSLPNILPADGVVVRNDDEKRFGIWIMPDNFSTGDLETFLRLLVPNQLEPVWTHAIESVTKARSIGASCRNNHLPKANLYTWLAWQDPPGQSPGIALTRKILNPHSPNAEAFVTWYRNLYEL